MAITRNLFVDMGSTYISPTFTALDDNGNLIDLSVYYLIAQFQNSRPDKFKYSFEITNQNVTLGTYQLKLSNNDSLFQIQQLSGQVSVQNIGQIESLDDTLGNVALGTGLISGTGYTNGFYTNVPLTGGHGTGATANLNITFGLVSAVTLTAGGSGYQVGDKLGASTTIIGGGLGQIFSIPVKGVFDLTDVVGTGTIFTQELRVGDTILIEASQTMNMDNVVIVSGDLRKVVTAVKHDTHVELDSAVSTPQVGVNYFKINNIQADRYYFDVLAVDDTTGVRTRILEGLVLFNNGVSGVEQL